MSLNDFIKAPLNDLINETNLKEKLDKSDTKKETPLMELSTTIKNKLVGRNDLNERQRRKMTRQLENICGYKIAYGHTDKDLEVKDNLRVIRTKRAYDFERLMPEVGRLAARQLTLDPTPEMSNYIAEWILTGAPKNTSAEAAAFEQAMRESPATAESLHEARESFQEESSMSALDIVKSRIRSENAEKSFAQKLGITTKELREEWLDDLDPVKRAVNQIEKIIGKKIPDNVNAYLESRMYKGRDKIAEIMVYTGTKDAKTMLPVLKERFPNVDFDGFKPIGQILDEAGGRKQLDDFMAYCTAKMVKDI